MFSLSVYKIYIYHRNPADQAGLDKAPQVKIWNKSFLNQDMLGLLLYTLSLFLSLSLLYIATSGNTADGTD